MTTISRPNLQTSSKLYINSINHIYQYTLEEMLKNK